MSRSLITVCILSFLSFSSVSQVITEPHEPIGPKLNNAPIILLHGFTGWGRDEAFGFNYWGGLVDVQQDLNERGHTVHTTASGPFSSSWDRACEIFAQIKGGTVDYGEAHSKAHGHARYGRTYDGLYPEWGEVNPETGEINKVHLVAHSQGGLDGRILIHLLSQGFKDEQNAIQSMAQDVFKLDEEEKGPEAILGSNGTKELSPLFKGGHDWVASLTTLSSPHDGTTLTTTFARVMPHHQYLISLSSVFWESFDLPGYDWKLDQWGLTRHEDESYHDYKSRVDDSRFWRSTRDTAVWNNSPEGAREINRWVKAQPNVFYFSYSNHQTSSSWFGDEQTPNLGMYTMFRPFAHWMGSHTENSPNRVKIDESWFPNDGIVNTISMTGPKVGSTDLIVEYSGQPKRGVWNHMGTLEDTDHIDYLGLFNADLSDPRPFFRKIADYVSALPN